MKFISIFIVLIAVVFTLSSSAWMNLEKTETASSSVTLLPQDDPAAAKFPEGAKIYQEKCIVCHMANGEGVANAFPPLKNSDYLFADKKRAVQQVLNGSHEEMTVNGAVYTMPMPHQVDTHQDAVHVINYVLNAWGNDGGTISLEEVKDIKIIRE